MSKDGFGSDLWKNVSAIKLGKHGGIEAPVRANSRQGLVVGLDAVAKSDARDRAGAKPEAESRRRRWRRFLHR